LLDASGALPRAPGYFRQNEIRGDVGDKKGWVMRDEDQVLAAKLQHHRAAGLTQGAPIALPIITATTFHVPDHTKGGYSYARAASPTWDEVEAQLSLLEEAPVVAFPSGMAAISAALMATLSAGTRVILPSDGYYVTRVFGETFLKSFGVQVEYLPTADFEAADFTGVGLVLIETPSNPGLDVCDIAVVAARAHAAGALVVADNTTMTPLLQRPLDLGADLVVAAAVRRGAGVVRGLAGASRHRDAGGAVEPHVRIGGGDCGAVVGASGGVRGAISGAGWRSVLCGGRAADVGIWVFDLVHAARCCGGGKVSGGLPVCGTGDEFRVDAYIGGTPRTLGRCGAGRAYPAFGGV